MRDGPGILAAETGLFHNVRILRRHCAQRDQARRIVMQIPGGAIQSGVAGRIAELANHFAVGIENRGLHRGLGLILELVIHIDAAAT